MTNSEEATVARIEPAATPLFVVYNPNAGSASDDAAQTAEATLGEVGFPVTMKPIENGRAIDRVAEDAARQAVAAGGAVVALGGDGTVNSVARAAWAAEAAMAILPGGTFNLVAHDLAIDEDIAGAARQLAGASIVHTPVGQLNGQLFLANASLGLYPRMLEGREFWRNWIGSSRLSAFAAALKMIIVPYRSRVLGLTHDGARDLRTTPALFVTRNHYQLETVGVELAQTLAETEFAALVPRAQTRGQLLRLLIQGMRGRLGDDPLLDAFAFRTMEVNLWPGLRRRIKVALDGEVCTMQLPLTFSIPPRRLRLLLGAGPTP